jgi:hypothetical protein
MVTQFTSRAMHVVFMGSTNSAGTWIYQQWFLWPSYRHFHDNDF